MTIRFDKNGVRLADVPGSGVSRVDPNATSGNPRHDTRSGKFGAGGGGGGQRRTPPANVDPVEYARMLDAVREAAREFEDPDEGDIRDFLKGRARSPEQVDVTNFLQQVVDQRKNDLVDWIDQQMRSSGPLRRGRRRVRISVPKGYIRRLLGKMDDNALAEIHHRLEAMGHDRSEVERFFEGRIKDDRHETIRSARDAIEASDDWELGGYLTLSGDEDMLLTEDEVDLIADRVVEKISASAPLWTPRADG
jgi:hypothetical protein